MAKSDSMGLGFNFNWDWGVGNKGVSFYTMNKGLNKVLMQEGALMIALGEMMNKLNGTLSDVSKSLQDVTKNLNWLNWLDTSTTTMGVVVLVGTLASGGLMGLSSMAMEPEVEDASSFTKGATAVNQMAQGSGSPKMQFLLGAVKSTMGAGIIISLLQSYFSVMTGVDNSKILKLKAYSDGCRESIKQEAGSEDKAAKTAIAIGKAEQKAIQEEYRSKTRELYYVNK